MMRQRSGCLILVDVSNVEHAGRRLDVLAALETLTVLTPTTVHAKPDLTDAVHWLIDDTWWDHRSPAEDIGLLLKDQEEADAISAVLEPLLLILDGLGPVGDDSAYLGHARWSDVRATAAQAVGVLTQTPGAGHIEGT